MLHILTRVPLNFNVKKQIKLRYWNPFSQLSLSLISVKSIHVIIEIEI